MNFIRWRVQAIKLTVPLGGEQDHICILGKSLYSLISFLDVCKGSITLEELIWWREEVESVEIKWFSETAGLKLDYSHLLCVKHSLFSYQIQSGDQTSLIGWENGCLFQRQFGFQEENHSIRVPGKEASKPIKLLKINL